MFLKKNLKKNRDKGGKEKKINIIHQLGKAKKRKKKTKKELQETIIKKIKNVLINEMTQTEDHTTCHTR